MNLSDVQQRLYDKLRGNGDVPIRVLFRTALRRWPEAHFTRADMQQRVGPYLTRLRRKLHPHDLTVVPGERRGTYRLAKLRDD